MYLQQQQHYILLVHEKILSEKEKLQTAIAISKILNYATGNKRLQSSKTH